MRSHAGSQASRALSDHPRSQRCSSSRDDGGSGEEPHGSRSWTQDISKYSIFGDNWIKPVIVQDLESWLQFFTSSTDVENRADESWPKSACFCWLQREPGVTGSAGNVCIVDIWSQVREIPHLPLLHLCFSPGTVTFQDKRLFQAPGLLNPVLSCLNKWQWSAG